MAESRRSRFSLSCDILFDVLAIPNRGISNTCGSFHGLVKLMCEGSASLHNPTLQGGHFDKKIQGLHYPHGPSSRLSITAYPPYW